MSKKALVVSDGGNALDAPNAHKPDLLEIVLNEVPLDGVGEQDLMKSLRRAVSEAMVADPSRPSRLDFLKRNPAKVAAAKLQAYARRRKLLTSNPTISQRNDGSYGFGLLLEEKLVPATNIPAEGQSRFVDQLRLSDEDVLELRVHDIPSDIREATRLLAERYSLDFHVNLFTRGSEGNWMNMFPEEIQSADFQNAHKQGYTGALSIAFSTKTADSEARTEECNAWYQPESKVPVRS